MSDVVPFNHMSFANWLDKKLKSFGDSDRKGFGETLFKDAIASRKGDGIEKIMERMADNLPEIAVKKPYVAEGVFYALKAACVLQSSQRVIEKIIEAAPTIAKGVGLPNINGGGNRSDDVRSAASELALLLKSRKEEEIKPPER
ncbi:MAG: hypothetical protein PHX43_00135, partial [Alphaproteobacteria bacterium]|nr:hypothetical protein [Alphaproteobacteria bacterium]